MSVQDAIFVLKTVVDTAQTIMENKRDIGLLAKLSYDVDNLLYETNLRLAELETTKAVVVISEDDVEEPAASQESKSSSKIALEKVELSLTNVNNYIDEARSRYPEEKKKVIALAPAPKKKKNKTAKKPAFGVQPNGMPLQYSVVQEELVDPTIEVNKDLKPGDPGYVEPVPDTILTASGKMATSMGEMAVAGAGAVGQTTMAVVSAAGDKMTIAKYLALLEDERKSVLNVMQACESMEQQKNILSAVQDVQGKMSPFKSADSKDLMLSAVVLQFPAISPESRGIKGWAVNRINQLRGKEKNPFPRGLDFVDGIYDPVHETHTADGVTSYVKRTDNNVWLVLNLPYSRWQVQASMDNTRSDCYAYCEQSFVQPERCSGHTWKVINREGNFDEYVDVSLTTTNSKSQLAVIDKGDRVSRLITSNKKMTTIEEVVGAMGLVAYSSENMYNVPLVLKACSCLIDVLRSKNKNLNAEKTAKAFALSTIDIGADVAAYFAALPTFSNTGVQVDPQSGGELTSLTRTFSLNDLFLNGSQKSVGGSVSTKIGLLTLLSELLNIHMSVNTACESILRCVRYLCRWGPSTAMAASSIQTTVNSFAAYPNFLVNVVKVLNKHQPYQRCVEQAIWCIAIFAKSRPKTFLKLNALEVIMHNSVDDYEPASDHVTNSPDAAAAVCHGLSTLISELGQKAMDDFDYCDGPQVTCKILTIHSSVEPVCANGCQLISNVLLVKPESDFEFAIRNAPFAVMTVMKDLFDSPFVVASAVAALVQMSKSDVLRALIIKTPGALSLFIRISECYQKQGYIIGLMRDLYDIINIDPKGRETMALTVAGGYGEHYWSIWDRVMAGVVSGAASGVMVGGEVGGDLEEEYEDDYEEEGEYGENDEDNGDSDAPSSPMRMMPEGWRNNLPSVPGIPSFSSLTGSQKNNAPPAPGST